VKPLGLGRTSLLAQPAPPPPPPCSLSQRRRNHARPPRSSSNVRAGAACWAVDAPRRWSRLPGPRAVLLAQPAPPRAPRAFSPVGVALLLPRSPAAAAPLMVTRWSQKSPGLKILWIWTLGTAASNRIIFFLPFFFAFYLIVRTHASAH